MIDLDGIQQQLEEHHRMCVSMQACCEVGSGEAAEALLAEVERLKEILSIYGIREGDWNGQMIECEACQPRDNVLMLYPDGTARCAHQADGLAHVPETDPAR